MVTKLTWLLHMQAPRTVPGGAMVQAPVKQEEIKQESPEPMDLDNAALIEQLAKDPAKLTQPIKVAAGVQWGMLLNSCCLSPCTESQAADLASGHAWGYPARVLSAFSPRLPGPAGNE